LGQKNRRAKIRGPTKSMGKQQDSKGNKMRVPEKKKKNLMEKMSGGKWVQQGFKGEGKHMRPGSREKKEKKKENGKKPGDRRK